MYMGVFFYELSVLKKMEQKEDAEFALGGTGKERVDPIPHSTMQHG